MLWREVGCSEGVELSKRLSPKHFPTSPRLTQNE